jgi:peptidoglycan/LPS O-acetylase OafA/YrhL
MARVRSGRIARYHNFERIFQPCAGSRDFVTDLQLMVVDASSPRYRPFGAFRFGLAAMVVLQHGLLLLAPPDRGFLYSAELGAIAVTTFFALSGFIVAEASASFYAGRPGAFLANRALRVVPPYLAAWAITVAVDSALYAAGRLVPLDAPLHGAPWQPAVLLAGVLEILPGLTAHRVSGQDFSFIPFAWTLRVEFAFYLAAFCTCWLMSWPAGGLAWRRAAVAGALGVAYLAFAAFAWRHWGAARGSGALQVICVPFFAFGLCLFFLGRWTGAGSRLHLLVVSGGVVLGFTFWGQRGHPVLAFQLPVLCVLFAALALLSRVRSVPDGVRRWDRRLGELSYPLYVSHGVVLSLLAGLVTRRGAILYVAAALLALMLAAALHVAVEQPLRAIRTRLRGATL